MEFLNQYSIMLLELITARNSDDKSMFYEKIYEAITSVYKDGLIKAKPNELCFVLFYLIKYYEAREEYEKCHKLNQVGFEIYNSIID
jgi:hypothetical protein